MQITADNVDNIEDSGAAERERERENRSVSYMSAFIHVCEWRDGKTPGQLEAVDRSTFFTACCWRFLMHVLRTDLGYRRAPRFVGGEPNFPNIETKPGAGHLQIGADTLGVHRLCWLPLTATCTAGLTAGLSGTRLLRSYSSLASQCTAAAGGAAALSNVPPRERKKEPTTTAPDELCGSRTA